jgi:hypothetical protein
MISPSYSLSRYLKAKQTVDERALNRRVADRYIEELDRLAGESNGALSIVDLGAGRGPTAQRVVQALREGAAQSIRYNLIDQSPQLLGEAATKLRSGERTRASMSRRIPISFDARGGGSQFYFVFIRWTRPSTCPSLRTVL